ncbi:MAG: helix-turn-helix transcriptional regulator [Microbacteriaceae bacterium]|jgi:DNA-binding CsgD family transcriptional regulator|nr:helix-turn-helix transcriptional regulator [Microbacteriaceae bacterium]MCI1207334.1 helix-turn-helix transcriptional regulator [Microbacteriaceae bacterium]
MPTPFVWLRRTQLFLTRADVQWQIDRAGSNTTVDEVLQQVGPWPQLVPLLTGLDTTHGTPLDAIRLIMTQADLPQRRRAFLRRCGAAELLTTNAVRTIWPENDRAELFHWAQDSGWISLGTDLSTLGRIPVLWRAVFLEDLREHAPKEAQRLLLALLRCYQEDSTAPAVLLRQARKTGDLALIAETYQAHAVELMAADADLATRTLESLPPSVFATSPMLRLVRSVTVAFLSAAGMGGLSPLSRASAPLVESPFESTFRTMLVSRVHGHVPEAVQAGLAFREHLEHPAPTDAPTVRSFADFFWLQLGITFLLNADHVQAQEAFQRSLRAGGGRHGFLQRDAIGKLALIEAFDGTMTAVRQGLARAAEFPLPGLKFQDRVLIAEQLAAAMLLVDAGKRDALVEVWRSEALRPKPDADELWAFRVFVAQRVAAALDLDMVAVHAIEKMISQGAPRHRDPSMALALSAKAQALISVGALSEARRILTGVLEWSEDQFTMLAAARLALLSGQYAEARSRTARLTTWAGCSQRAVTEGLFVKAAATWCMGDHSEAVSVLRTALRSTEALGISSAVSIVPEAVAAELFPAAGAESPFGPHTTAVQVPTEAPSLSAAELKVLDALALTGSTAEIAEQLHLSRNTIKTHLRRLYASLGVHSRAEALQAARQIGALH